MRTVILVVLLLLVLGLVALGLQNLQPVTVRFLFFDTGEVSLALVVVLAALSGAVLATLGGTFLYFRLGINQRRQQKAQATLEARNAELERKVQELEARRESAAEVAPVERQPH